MSTIKLGWKALCGFLNPFGSVAESLIDYALGVLKNAAASLSDGTREKIQAALNTAQRVLSVLTAVKWLVPTKWQTAYAQTLSAVAAVVNSLTDLELTADELKAVQQSISAAIAAWNDEDDDTCVE